MRLTAHPVARDKGDIMRELNQTEIENITGGLIAPGPSQTPAKVVKVAVKVLKAAVKKLVPAGPQL